MVDPRNARRTDPETSLEGTEGINDAHTIAIIAFIRDHPRPQGWTSGELYDAMPLERDQIWRRVSDAHIHRHAIEPVIVAGDIVTRVWHGTNRAQQAYRIATGPPAPAPVPVPRPPRLPPSEVLERRRAVYDDLQELAARLGVPLEVVASDVQWIAEAQLYVQRSNGHR